MTTHQFAGALAQLARALKSAPDMELSGLLAMLHPPISVAATSPDEVALSLSTLAALSKIDKAQWTELIREYGLPIDLRARDASRDILGKLLRYLEANPEALAKLRVRARRSSKASPELMRTLELLMRGGGG